MGRDTWTIHPSFGEGCLRVFSLGKGTLTHLNSSPENLGQFASVLVKVTLALAGTLRQPSKEIILPVNTSTHIPWQCAPATGSFYFCTSSWSAFCWLSLLSQYQLLQKYFPSKFGLHSFHLPLPEAII